jgi:hypothetical protein
MNILQRRMFAQGDVVNAGPQPRVDIPKLIQYYVSQGYNAVEIKEMIPDVSFSEIESVVSGLGGSVNPAIASTGADEFTGNINVFQEIPETKVIQRQAPKVELPKNVELDQIRKYIEATKDLGTENQILGLKVNFNLTDEEAKEYLALPDTSVGMTDPSLASLDAVEVVEEPLSTTGLAPNEYRTSDGRIFSIDPQKLKSLLAGENARTISGILLNPKAEYGSDLAAIVESEALGRSSTLVDPKSIKVGGVDEFTGLGDVRLGLRPGQLISETGKFVVDFAKEGIEGLVNQARKLGSSEMVGIFRGREAAKKAKAAGRDEPLNIFETPLDSQSGFLKNLEEIKQYQLTGGETPETLDSIILEASVGEVTPDNISKQLEDLEKTSPTPITPEAATKETVEDIKDTAEDVEKTLETEEELGEDGLPINKEVKEVISKKGADAILPETIDDSDAEVRQVSSFFYNNPNFIRLLSNLSAGLATSPDMATGLAVGAAAAAKERKAADEAAALAEIELKKERLKELGPRDKGIVTAVRDSKINLSKSYRDYQEAASTERLANIVKSYLDTGDITSLAARLGVAQDRLFTLVGLGPEQINDQSPRGKAQVALTILKQKNIRAILNESSRTISNTDREIADKIAGSLEDFDITTPGALRQKMEENIRSAREGQLVAQRTAKAEYGLLEEFGDAGSLDEDLLQFLTGSLKGSYDTDELKDFQDSLSGFTIIDL